MAKIKQRRPENIAGDFYVDSTCIDCDTCRWMAPEIFTEKDEQSAVYHQPQNQQERVAAMQALLSCPTSSIGTVEKPQDVKEVQKTFPLLITENIYHCGYHSEQSYGAASYFIRRSEGNILVDSPRYSAPLVKQLEAMGGVKYMYLTHRDDVADHARFQEHFKCVRILHIEDVKKPTQDVEIKIQGRDAVQLAPGLLIIYVPGHTRGHTALLYQDKYLFTGDHLAWSESLQNLHAFRDVCWYSWPEQIKSMRLLLNYRFEWVLPGHGRRFHANYDTMREQLIKCINWMEKLK